MRLKVLGTKLFAAIMAFATMPLAAQVEVNYEKYPDYAPPTRGDRSLMVRKTDATKQRPVRVNNAKTKHFPTIFNQDGGSCGSASRMESRARSNDSLMDTGVSVLSKSSAKKVDWVSLSANCGSLVCMT